MNITADASGLPAAGDVEALFNACIKRTFTSDDVKFIQASCQKLAGLCQVSSFVYHPHKRVFQDFKDRSLTEAPAGDEGKKEKKKKQKLSKKEKKKAKKQKKKDEKKAKKAKKEAKKQKKKAKKAEKKHKKHHHHDHHDHHHHHHDHHDHHDHDKKAKKEAKRQAKKDKKRLRKGKRVSSKLEKKVKKLEKEEKKLAKEIAKYMDKQGVAVPGTQELSPNQIEERLEQIKASLTTRDRSISRFAPCLVFTKESGGKDAVDSQCATLKRASDLTLQAEECWAGYLSTVQHCKEKGSSKKSCYDTFASANSRCGGLAARGRTELLTLLTKEQPEKK